MYSASQGDYLRAIFNIYETKGKNKMTSIEVVDSLGFSKAAVSNMLKKLNNQKLIKMAPYSSFSLTVKGRREAEKITYKHRVIEVFLADYLKIEKEKVHQEAHLLEHAFSDEVVVRLSDFLGNPEFCPNGRRIPKI